MLVTGVVTPADLAKTVVDRYVTEATTNIVRWQREYRARIMDYTADLKRQDTVRGKLEAWYSVFVGAIPEIRELWSRIKARYKPPTARPAPVPPA